MRLIEAAARSSGLVYIARSESRAAELHEAVSTLSQSVPAVYEAAFPPVIRTLGSLSAIERKRIKNGYQRRARQQKRRSILAELEAIRAEQECLAATIGEVARRSSAPPVALGASQAAAMLGVRSERALR